MPWQGIDFLGISLNDEGLVDKLDQFLEERLDHLACGLMQLFPSLFEEGQPTAEQLLAGVAPAPRRATLPKKLLQLLSARQAELVRDLRGQQEEWETTLRQLNALLWEQLELLEGSAKELFLQLSHVGIDRWNSQLQQVVRQFQQLLLRHVEELHGFLVQLDEELMAICSQAELKVASSFWLWLKKLGRLRPVDETLKSHLEGCKQFLISHYEQFCQRYQQFQELIQEIDQRGERLVRYQILNSLGEKSANTYRTLYRLLKLWQRFSRQKQFPKQELASAFFAISRDRVVQLLRSYHQALEVTLFDKSRTLKTTPRQLFEQERARSFLMEMLQGYRSELQTLCSVIVRYRDYLVSSDPDPYVRSRWGYGDTPVASAPSYAAKLTEMAYQAEELDGQCERFIEAFAKGPTDTEELIYEADGAIQRYLHELGQPLVPASLFRARAEKVLGLLDGLDEMGSFGRELVDYVKQILSRLLRADWKGHFLHEMAHFENTYQLHQKVIGPSIDKAHQQRLEKLSQLQKQLLAHIQEGKELKAEEESETEYQINDIKGYLQDFLASIQRSLLYDQPISPRRARRHIEEVAQQLLEYRYLFGRFFAKMIQSPEGRHMRMQFLFVAHYFETIENQIYEFRVQRGLIEEPSTSESTASADE